MQIHLGRRADYAVRAVLYLASHPGARSKGREIAQAMDVPNSYLPQILAMLARAQLVNSVAGPEGGYALARDPGDVSLLEVVTAVDGEVRSRDCVLRGGPCRWEDRCAVHEPWARAQQALLDQLAATHFDELVLADQQLAAAEASVRTAELPVSPLAATTEPHGAP